MNENRGLRRFSKLLLIATFFLIIAGALVTSTESGLSVPDWPTSYGYSMFTFPVHDWVGGIKFEHGHRLIASTVGFLTVIFLVWAFLREKRRWMKVMAAVALLAVIAQGVLGGLTVLHLLPPPISVAHACLAQTFFCLTLALALFESRWWKEESFLAPPGSGGVSRGLRRWAIAAFAVVYLQLILGAWMRHIGAGLAIPDFPASFGGILPNHWSQRIAVHFSHRVWAIVVLLVVALAAIAALRTRRERWIRRPAIFVLILLPVQIVLGAFSVLTRKAVPITVAHVVTGALILAMTTWMAIGIYRAAWLEKQKREGFPEALPAEAR